MIVDRPAQPATEAGAELCRNCGAALTGRYCAKCGQAADVHMPTTLELVHQALEGITHSDSWARTLTKTAALFAVYLVVLSITLTSVFVYALLQL
jgi:hypothetical protein